MIDVLFPLGYFFQKSWLLSQWSQYRGGNESETNPSIHVVQLACSGTTTHFFSSLKNITSITLAILRSLDPIKERIFEHVSANLEFIRINHHPEISSLGTFKFRPCAQVDMDVNIGRVSSKRQTFPEPGTSCRRHRGLQFASSSK